MGNQYIGIAGNFLIVAALAIGYAITHEHRNPVESQTLNLDAGIAEIMHIVVKTVDIGSIQAVIVVAADEILWRYGKSQNQLRKSIASCSLPTMQKSPE